MHIDILRRLRYAVRRFVSPSHSAPAQRSALIKDFLAKNNVTTLVHPP
jgi:hypothetical protein